MNTLRFAAILQCCAATVFAGTAEIKTPVPVEPADRWELRLSVPGWLAGVEGDTGVRGKSAYSRLGFDELAPKIDMTASLRAELRKGRFGIYADFLYLSLSDGFGSKGILKKVSFREDEYELDLGLSWRIIDSPRGYLEVIGGVRYTNIFTEVNLQSNEEVVKDVSDRLSRAGTVARGVLRNELRSVSGESPKVPGPQPAGSQADSLANDIRAASGTQKQRAERIERRLDKALNRRLVSSEYWFDPYVGLRGLYNCTDRLYLLGRADIGGFSVGADLSWQASAGFGWKLTEKTFFEATYRAIGVDYENDGYIYNTVTYGPEVSLGVIF